MQNRKLTAFFLTSLSVAIILIIAWGAVKYLLPCLLPFIFAFFTAWLLEPVTYFFRNRFHFRRSFASAICVLFVILAVTGILSLLVSRLAYQGIQFFKELPSLLSGLPELFSVLESKLDGYVKSSPPEIQKYLTVALDGLSQRITEIPIELSEKVLATLSKWAGNTPAVLLFCTAYAIGSYFISRSYTDIRKFLIRQIPPHHRQTARNLKRDLLDSFISWLKAQLTLLGITFLELTLALTLMGFRYAVLISLLIAAVDALPVLGTGVIMFPWAAVLALMGDMPHAFGMTVTCLIVTLARSFLEPRLVGAKFGIDPAATLLSMYTGFRICGVMGMVLFPLMLLMLKQMNDKGYIKLWK